MRKFFGVIGFSQSQTEVRPGANFETIIEREYFGDIIRDVINQQTNASVLPEFSLGNSFSIVADAYAHEHFGQMRYIIFGGVRWSISQVEDQRPRIIIRPGGVYNGPTPTTP